MALALGGGGGIMEVSKTPWKKEDSYYSSGAGANSNEPYHASTMYSYSQVKGWIQSTDSFDLYAGVFQKNGKTYAAMVIIRWYHS